LKIMQEKGKITTFFNFRANENTGFAKLTKNVVEMYIEKTEKLNGNPYAVFCYPNFTILPKYKTSVKISEGINLSDELSTNDVYLEICGIYVDSSYVAAGLMAGMQNPDYLAKKFGNANVNKNYACVRFDPEEGMNRFVLQTSLNREGSLLWDKQAESAINKEKFGFCFCGNEKIYQGKKVSNSYIYLARCMKKDVEKEEYDPIYMQMTMDYVRKQIDFLPIISTSTINKVFMKESVGPWTRDAEAKPHYVNNMLKIGESIVLEDTTLKVKFNGTESTIEDLIIEKA